MQNHQMQSLIALRLFVQAAIIFMTWGHFINSAKLHPLPPPVTFWTQKMHSQPSQIGSKSTCQTVNPYFCDFHSKIAYFAEIWTKTRLFCYLRAIFALFSQFCKKCLLFRRAYPLPLDFPYLVCPLPLGFGLPPPLGSKNPPPPLGFFLLPSPKVRPRFDLWCPE